MIIIFFNKNKNILLISVDFYFYYFILKNNESIRFRVLKFLINYKKNKFSTDIRNNYNFLLQRYQINTRDNIKTRSNKRENYKNLVNNIFWINNKILSLNLNILFFFSKFDMFSRYKINSNHDIKFDIKSRVFFYR